MAGARKGKGEGKIGRAQNARSEGEGKRKRLQPAHCLFRLAPSRSQQRRLLSDWLLKIVVSSFPTARCDAHKNGFRSGGFNLWSFGRFI